jgi:hypothetical protein
LIFYRETWTICWSTCGNLFTLTNIHHIAITADSENGQEDAEQGELCVESWKRKMHFNILGESGRVAGKRVETLYFFSPPACGMRGAVRGGPGPRRQARRAAAAAHARVCRSAVTAWDPSPATAWVPSAATVWDASFATAWVPSPATAWGA